MFKTADDIVMQTKETQDEFIFSTLSDFASTNYNITVDKKELIMAIQFIRMCNETGTDLRQYYSTATDGTELYRKGYNTGFENGVKETRERLEKSNIRQKGECKIIKEFFETRDHLCFKLQHIGRYDGGWKIQIYNTTLDLDCAEPIYEHIVLDSEIDNSNVDFETLIMTPVINCGKILHPSN